MHTDRQTASWDLGKDAVTQLNSQVENWDLDKPCYQHTASSHTGKLGFRQPCYQYTASSHTGKLGFRQPCYQYTASSHTGKLGFGQTMSSNRKIVIQQTVSQDKTLTERHFDRLTRSSNEHHPACDVFVWLPTGGNHSLDDSHKPQPHDLDERNENLNRQVHDGLWVVLHQ